MKVRALFSTAISAVLLVGCGDDHTGLLDEGGTITPPPIISQLQASPLVMTLDAGQRKTVDVSPSVSSVGIEHWALVDVSDANGLGQVSNIQGHTFDYTAAETSEGVTTLPYRVEGEEHVASSEVLVVIHGLSESQNTPPSANDLTFNLKSTETLTIDLNKEMVDSNGDVLAVRHLVSASERFMLGKDNIVTFTPAGYVGVDTAAYSVDDGRGGYDVAYIVANVVDSNPSEPNHAPEAKDFSQSINSSDTPVWELDVAALGLISDADGDALEITKIVSSENRAQQQGKTKIRYTPGAFIGVDQFTYVISDDHGSSATGTVTMTVAQDSEKNGAPIATQVDASGIHELDTVASVISVAENVTDPDGDELRIVSLVGAVGEVSLSSDNPLQVLYTPNGARTSDGFSYVVTDGRGGYAMSEVKVLLTASSAPIAHVAKASTTSDREVSVDLSAYISDADNGIGELSLSSIEGVTAPATVSLSGWVVTYHPNGVVGVDTLTYQVSDGRHSTPGVVVVSSQLADNDHTLSAEDISLEVEWEHYDGAAIEIDWVGAVDSDSVDSAPYTLVAAVGASLGRVNVNEGRLYYTPEVGRYGEDRIVYTVADNHTPHHYAQGVVHITLIPPMAPEITALSIDGMPAPGALLRAQVTCADCDPNGYTYEWVVNGLTVSTSESYHFRAEDMGYNLKLSVKGQDRFGQWAEQQYVTYAPSVVETVIGSDFAFAALKTDGSVVTWGSELWGGDSSAVQSQLTNVAAVYTNAGAFAARTKDGAVVTWGNDRNAANSDAVQSQLVNVVEVFSNNYVFAALRGDGSVVTWGKSSYGGDSSMVQEQLNQVKAIYGSDFALVALKHDGTVVTWGDGKYGGDSSFVQPLLTGVQSISSTDNGFAALKTDGTVVSWGGGGNYDITAMQPELSGVKAVFASDGAFAALKHDGTVVSWGPASQGGDSSAVQPLLTGVTDIVSTYGAFAALKGDGTVVTWGTEYDGGDSSAVQSQLRNVSKIYSAPSAFAAVKEDGTVVAWGHGEFGGDSSAVQAELTGVRSITAAGVAFAALKWDGTVVAWGSQPDGGDASAVQSSLTDIKTVYEGGFSFVAQKSDSSLVSWGMSSFEEEGSSVAERLAPSYFKLDTSINGVVN